MNIIKSIKTRTKIMLYVALLGLLLSSGVYAKTLSLALSSPPTETGMNKALNWWADELKEQTDGELEIKFYYLQSLVKFQDAAGAVSSGVADMAYISFLHSQPQTPLWYLANTRTETGDQYVVAEAFKRAREQFEPLREEEKKNNMKYIAHTSNGPQVFISKNKPYLTPTDFKGEKVRMPGSLAQVARKAKWNVNSVSLPFPEVYSAMERGAIDGAVTYIPHIRPYSHNEVAKHAVEPRIGQNSNGIMMNLDTWNSLTKEQQDIIEGLQDELLERLVRGSLDDEAKERDALKNHEKYPLEFHELSDEQRNEWAEAMEIGAAEMITQMTRFTPHAADFHELYLAEIVKVEKEVEENGYPWERD